MSYLFLYQKKSISDFSEDADVANISIIRSFITILFSGTLLWLGSETLIKSAVSLASKFQISERIIGVSIVAIGTSIPELAASVVASLKKQNDLSIGNLIGSNIFNLLVVIGITSSVKPISNIEFSAINYDMIWVLFFSIVLLPMALVRRKNILTRNKGIILLLLYLMFIIPLFK